MKRILVRESFSEEQQESVLKMYFQIPDSDRKKIKKAIKECLREFTSQNDVLKLEIGIGLFGLASLVYGLFAKDASIWGMGIAALGFAGVSLKVDRNAILKCAADKLGMEVDEMMDIKRGKNQESSEMMPESRRVVKLTESDLNRIVRRIIKEDEMMMGSEMNSTEMAPKGFVKTTLKELLSKKRDLSGYYGGKANNDYEYYKAYYPKSYAKIIGGKAFEPTPGGFGDIRPRISFEKMILMKENGNLTVSIQEDKDTSIDTYTLTCRGGKVTISDANVGP
jgi:hypothetical protein